MGNHFGLVDISMAGREYMPLSFEEAVEKIASIRSSMETYIVGQPELVTDTLCCLLASGHLLITGAPGLAKTTLVRVLAKHMQLTFRRVQCTPDLLPSDILGSEILNLDSDTQRRFFEFQPGPIFTHLLLTDEINRASPRTQSALLEAMQERGITIAGKRHALEKPFMVFATQNPYESEGTFPLPEAQLDRFLLHTWVSYPSEAHQLQLLEQYAERNLVGEILDEWEVERPCSPQDLQELQAQCAKMPVPAPMLHAINELVISTRPDHPHCPETMRGYLQFGGGPRAALALVAATQALSLLEGKKGVTWAHVKRMATPALRHRMRLTMRALREGWTVERVIETLVVKMENRYADLSLGKEPTTQRI